MIRRKQHYFNSGRYTYNNLMQKLPQDKQKIENVQSNSNNISNPVHSSDLQRESNDNTQQEERQMPQNYQHQQNQFSQNYQYYPQQSYNWNPHHRGRHHGPRGHGYGRGHGHRHGYGHGFGHHGFGHHGYGHGRWEGYHNQHNRNPYEYNQKQAQSFENPVEMPPPQDFSNYPHHKDLPYRPHPPHHNPPPMHQGSLHPPREQYHRYKKHEGKHWKKRSYSKSSSSSSSSQDRFKKSKFQPKVGHKKEDDQLQIYYRKQMNDFLQSRQVNEHQRQKIVKVLCNRFPQKNAPIDTIIKYLEYMQRQNLVYRMPYVKLIKVTIRFQFQLEYIVPKIQKIQQRRIRKFQADQQFAQNHGDKEITPLLDVNDLILNNNNVVYLVDGNNILPTNKHFRKYFQSQHAIEKAIAQIKCQWYLSHAFNQQQLFLFFDEKYEEKDFKYAKEQTILQQQQRKRYDKIQVIYGEGTKADNKIVEKLKQLTAKDQKIQIILISADRDLIMRCQEVKTILHTSGKFFIKYAKYKINRKYKGNREMKVLTKRIMHYEQFY